MKAGVKTDEELMITYTKGEQLEQEEAFLELYQRHRAKVLGYLRKKLTTTGMAEDAFQQTWMKLHVGRHRYDPTLPFLPWLFCIARNCAVDVFRKDELVLGTASDFGTSERVLNIQQEVEPDSGTAVTPKLDGIPSRYKEALELRYSKEMSFEEIAKKLNVTPENARQRVSRALRYMRRFFKTEEKV
ncbi:MAG: sigma-70 family RNA polymerase sigma factor [Bdellovibrio sp.]|nr:sigma-70 family RNA polymerase sigma factor [Bdellovibrio sp.]